MDHPYHIVDLSSKHGHLLNQLAASVTFFKRWHTASTYEFRYELVLLIQVEKESQSLFRDDISQSGKGFLYYISLESAEHCRPEMCLAGGKNGLISAGHVITE